MVKFVNLSRCFLLMMGLSVHQLKSDSIHHGIIMNGANETEDSGNTALVDGSIDKSEVQLQNVIGQTNGSIPQQSSEISIDQYIEQYIAKHSGAVVMKSDQKDNTNQLKKVSFDRKQDIEIVIHLLDMNKYTNYLQISGTSTNGTKQIHNFTEAFEPKNRQTILLINVYELEIFFEFEKSESNHYRGYVLTYELLEAKQEHNGYGLNELNAPKTLETLSILIEVPEVKQVNETYKLFRMFLANSTNQYIRSKGMNVENCSEDNVTLVNIERCVAAWPNTQQYAQVEFSVRLKFKSESLPTEKDEQNGEFDVNHTKLMVLWVEYGRKVFADNGFNEYSIPDERKLLLLWISVSLTVVAAFIMVLAAIWKMDVLRDYRRMYWKNSDDEKQICKSSDVAMYPTVHQTVPTLFPNDLTAPHNASNDILPFEFVSKPISYSINDFKRRSSIAESLNPNANVKRKAGEVPFQCDTDFSESKQDRPEDEVYFSHTKSTSPRLVN